MACRNEVKIIMDQKEEIKLNGGHLNLEMLNAIFNTIPQEFDVLDENDKVVWSSMNKHRLFKRTEDDIGKTVYEVHPGHSQSRVKQVLEQMHDDKRGSLSLVVTHDKKPISISFYALHNEDGKYIGCIEVTQPVDKYQVKGSKWRNILNILKKK